MTFAKIQRNGGSEFSTKITELLEEVEVRTTKITQADMISMHPSGDERHQCLISLTFPAKNHVPTGTVHKTNPINEKENPTETGGSTEPSVETKNL